MNKIQRIYDLLLNTTGPNYSTLRDSRYRVYVKPGLNKIAVYDSKLMDYVMYCDIGTLLHPHTRNNPLKLEYSNGEPYRVIMGFHGTECRELSVYKWDDNIQPIQIVSHDISTEEARFQMSLVSDLELDYYTKLLDMMNEVQYSIPAASAFMMRFTVLDEAVLEQIFDAIIITIVGQEGKGGLWAS